MREALELARPLDFGLVRVDFRRFLLEAFRTAERVVAS